MINNYCHPTQRRVRGKRPKHGKGSPVPKKEAKWRELRGGECGWGAGWPLTVS